MRKCGGRCGAPGGPPITKKAGVSGVTGWRDSLPSNMEAPVRGQKFPDCEKSVTAKVEFRQDASCGMAKVGGLGMVGASRNSFTGQNATAVAFSTIALLALATAPDPQAALSDG